MADVHAYLDLPYTKTITRDDDVFVAEVREWPGCVAHGATEAEALAMLREAQIAWVEGVLEQGKAVPLPEAAADLPSGKFVLRLPRYLHKRLADAAQTEETTLNQLATAMIVEGLATRATTRNAQRDQHPENEWGANKPAEYKWVRRVQEQSVRFTEPLRKNARSLDVVSDVHEDHEQIERATR